MNRCGIGFILSVAMVCVCVSDEAHAESRAFPVLEATVGSAAIGTESDYTRTLGRFGYFNSQEFELPVGYQLGLVWPVHEFMGVWVGVVERYYKLQRYKKVPMDEQIKIQMIKWQTP